MWGVETLRLASPGLAGARDSDDAARAAREEFPACRRRSVQIG